MSDLVTGLKLTGTPFVTSIVQISYPWFHQEAEERPTGSKGCPAHREMKFVSDEDTTSTQPQTHTEVRREMREKNFPYLMAELEDHYANASKHNPALPSTLWVRQWEPKPFQNHVLVEQEASNLSFHHSAFNRANFLGNIISCVFYNFKIPLLQEPGLWSHK